MSLPVAIQVYSVRKDAEADLPGTLRKIRDMGYDGVEFAGLYGHTAAEVKAMCAEVGLTPISAHVPFVDMLKDPWGVLSQYAEIGCKYVAVPYLIPEHRPGTPNFEYVVAFIEIIAKAAKKLGMQMLYHNHDFEFMKLDGKYALDILYETVPADLLKTELDVCWVNVGGEEPAAYLRKYAGRAPVVHLKDYVGRKGEGTPYGLIGQSKQADAVAFEFRPFGHGCQDAKAVVEAGIEAGAEWFVIEQDQWYNRTPMEAAKMSIDTLYGLGLKTK